MAQTICIYTPRLKIARLFTASIILDKANFIEELALPYPRELRRELLNFAANLTSWRKFQKHVVDLMGSYGYSWLDMETPLLFTLKLLHEKNHNINIVLYGSLVGENKKYRIVTELISLALKARLTGKIDLREWDSLIEKMRKARRVNLGPILKRAKQAIVVLEEKTLPLPNAILIEALPGYVESPLEKIVSATAEKLKDAIRDYVDYVLDYLVKYSSVDYAYFKWIKDKNFKGLIADLSDHYLYILSTLEEH